VATVDVHQHLWPEQLLSALSGRRDPPRLRGRTLELAAEGASEIDPEAHDLTRRVALLDRDEIDVAVVSLQPTIEIEGRPELIAAYHEGIVELVAASAGRIRALSAGEVQDGFVGASVSAAAFVAGVEPLLTELEEAGRFLFVHPGPPSALPPGAPAWWPGVVAYTAQMQAAYVWWLSVGAPLHPRLRVVFAILAGGGPFQAERLASRGEPASTPHGVFLETASYGRRAIELCLANCGPGRVVYGSDMPVIDPRATLEAIRGLGDAAADAILAENPARLLE